jgi:hypothetical protein
MILLVVWKTLMRIVSECIAVAPLFLPQFDLHHREHQLIFGNLLDLSIGISHQKPLMSV